MDTLSLVAQLTTYGLIAGSFYALMGVSWGVIYITTHTFHFSHALTFVVAAYAAVTFVSLGGFPLVLGVLLAVVVASLFGAAIEVVLYRPLRNKNAPHLVLFLSSLGFLIVGESVIRLIYGPGARALPGFQSIGISIGPVAFSSRELLMVVGSWVIIGLVLIWLGRTKFGKAIRAVANNYDLSFSIGVDPKQIYVLVYALGSAMVAFAAVFFVLRQTATPTMAVAPLMAGFVAVFLGSTRYFVGAIIGGLALGLAENWAGLFLPGHWQVVVAFVLLFLILVFKPEGLLSFFKQR